MLLVDDRLALAALIRRPAAWGDRVPTLPWMCQYRLLRALVRSTVQGQLSRYASDDIIEVVQAPPPDVLRIHDPRILTSDIVDTAHNHKLSITAAEMLAVASRYGAEMHLAARNIGPNLHTALTYSDITVHTYTDADLPGARPAGTPPAEADPHSL